MTAAPSHLSSERSALRQRAENCAKYDFDTVEMIECKWALWDEILETLSAGNGLSPQAQAGETKSAPVQRPSHSSGERLPSGDAAGAGAGTSTLAQAEQQRGEPVAWFGEYDGHLDTTIYRDTMERWETLGRKITPLYASPPAALPAGEITDTLNKIAQLTNVGRGDLMSLQDALHDIHKVATGALAMSSTQSGCGDPSCKDPECTYGKGPNTDPLSSTHRSGEA